MTAHDADQALRAMCDELERMGYVKPTFVDAVLVREAASPTGLPMAGRKVAIPHADPEHVVNPAIAVATLNHPVIFREMGNPGSELEVEVIVMLALTDRESVQQELVRMVELFQNAEFVDKLYAAPDGESLLRLLLDGEPS